MNKRPALAAGIWGIIFVAAYRLAVGYGFSGPPHIVLECATVYGIWRLTMRKIGLSVCIALVFASCGQKERAFENRTPEEKWEIMQEYYMVPGTPVSTERPLSNVLSEQEVLLKAADFAIAESVLDSSYYAYEKNPALMDAKIESPILVTDAASGVPDMYILNAVDDDGISLARISVSSNLDDMSGVSFVRGRSISEASMASDHIITKREAVELIQSQFKNMILSEPVAVGDLRLGDDPHSHIALFWYFTVSENARSTEGAVEEYVIDADIAGYRSIPGGVSNRAAINLGRGSPHLDGYRMAKLDKPLRLFDKLKTARAAGGASFAPASYPSESIGFTPVPLK
jgi:hypothetical protein